MNKIPLGQAIAFGYAFLVTEFLTVLRICWIPALLVVSIEYLGRRYTLYYSNGSDGAGFALVDFVVVSSGLFISLLASSVMAVGITRAAMGLPLNTSNFYFPLGRTEWRMLGANIRYILAGAVLLFLAAIISAIALFLAGVEFGQPVDDQAAGFAVLLASLLSILVFGSALIVAVRLAFFLPAIVVSEDKGLERAYGVATGNVWRIFVVLFAIAAPFLFAGAFFQASISYAAFGEDALAGELEAMIANVEAAAAARPLLWAAYGFVINVVIMGIFPSAAAFAYLKITEGAGKAPGGITPPPRV